ncbi:putative glycerophosphodiester phosphodiesterase, protein kinase RLK-Pelle-LRK10L-2 family [Medicago truncatula]|nr:PR5-like receptor kinase isoform X1 [Medicago truncatula]RHN52761.1 putative glycerophosphodiester phosphodiesterase, protein kinase RLK-Pelle-LRK10L-2 family [Medicago truncatula]
MASNINGLVFVLLAVANLLHGSVAKTFTVGDGLGWTIPSVGSQFYVNWATNKTFTSRDTLVFNYQLNAHAVAWVTKSDFDSCNGTNALAVMTKPPAKVFFNLSTVGQQYFICTFPGHCSAGQKLSIFVDEVYVLPTSSPTAPVPSPVQEPAPTATTSPAPATVCSNGTRCDHKANNSRSITLSPTRSPSPTGNHSNWKRKVIIGVVTAVMAVLLLCTIIYCLRSKLLIRQGKLQFRTKNDTNIEAFLKDHGALLQKRYKYSEIKKMTDSFKVKLGQGGFGVVYKGKLFNGCHVAIKILNSSKGNGEEFINEVSSITRTSHVNVVTLLGFCFEGTKKALIYEFMSNGSLDKFIYNKGPETIASLSWENLYQIAKGIARGLEYLHRGCTTRILHFDIKPHNILLDENLCPKISDFGLAKLCPKQESIISMSDQRGTMGYVAPEVWNRHFGGVSHKSDVYSYGMMLLEMVGGRKNIIADASHTSEIYFPHWVYNRLELGTNLRPDGVMDTEEDEIARRMTIVGLWCIQTFPSDRPTMSKVIEMLEVNMNSLEIPPKPLLSSPTRSISESSKS